MTTAKPHILIAGAGLGGLTAAIALAQRGFRVDVFEQAHVLAEVGAGLTVSRSAQSVLAELGLLDKVRQIASITSQMAFLHYRTGDLLVGARDESDGRWSADKSAGGIHIHRADMHRLLAGRFAELAPGHLHLGKRMAAFVQSAERVDVRFGDGTVVSGDYLVGADGVRSAVRDELWGDDAPRFTGQIAYRFMVPGPVAAPFMTAAGRAAVYQGPGRVFNRYSLRGGDLVNCVGITRSDEWGADGWSTPAQTAEMLALYEGWHEDVIGLMRVAPADHLIKWALFDRKKLPGWRKGRVTLLGDAAHPMLPFLGLGAAMAIEDAMVLARALDQSPDEQGLDIYERVRRPRVRTIANLSRLQGELSQSRDPDNYDAATAPAQNKALQDYDPVTEPL